MVTNFKSLPESYWKEHLSEEEYRIMRQKGTEPAFCGLYTDSDKPGQYSCKACKTPLFTSNTKFHSGSGWPSFYDALDNNVIELHKDNSFGMVRTEVNCASCGSHLGHLFDDGPPPTGQRYCINSIALEFTEAKI